MKVTLLLAAIVCIAAAQDTPICQPVVDSETGATYDLSPLANDMIDYDIPNPEYVTPGTLYALALHLLCDALFPLLLLYFFFSP